MPDAQAARSTYYYQPIGESPVNLALMRRIDALFMELPFFGSRQMRNILRDEGCCVGRERVRRLMRKMGLMTIYRKPRTSQPHPQHKVYPYLLRNIPITRPNQVWCADITYIPMKRGYLYSSRLWTGTAGRCCVGGFQTRWMPTSAWQPWKKP